MGKKGIEIVAAKIDINEVISDFKQVEKNLKELSAKNTQLEEKFNDLLAYLRTNSIQVPTL